MVYVAKIGSSTETSEEKDWSLLNLGWNVVSSWQRKYRREKIYVMWQSYGTSIPNLDEKILVMINN